MYYCVVIDILGLFMVLILCGLNIWEEGEIFVFFLEISFWGFIINIIFIKIEFMILGKMCWNIKVKYNFIINNGIMLRLFIRYEYFLYIVFIFNYFYKI